MGKRVLDVNGMKRQLWMHRKQAGLSRFELSCRIGYQENTIYFWERMDSKRLPPLEALVELAEVYGIEPGDLIITTAMKE